MYVQIAINAASLFFGTGKAGMGFCCFWGLDMQLNISHKLTIRDLQKIIYKVFLFQQQLNE